MVNETINTTKQSSSPESVDSKIIHLWMLLPNPPDNFANELQKTVFQFVSVCCLRKLRVD